MRIAATTTSAKSSGSDRERHVRDLVDVDRHADQLVAIEHVDSDVAGRRARPPSRRCR